MRARRIVLLLSTASIVLMLATSLLAACAEPAPSPAPTPSPAPSPAPAPPQVLEWRMQQHVPPGDVSSAIHSKLIEMIDKNTGGQIKITLHPLDSIVPQKEMFTAVATGTLDMSSWDPGYSVGTIPVAGVESGLPCSYRSGDETFQILWDYGLEELSRAECAKQGVYLGVDYPIGLGGYGLALRKPIESYAELKGVKIRSFSYYNKLLEDLGASPVSIPLGEAYMAATTGTIDGVLTAWNAIHDLKLYEALNYGILPSTTGAGCQNIIINLEAWNALPDETRTIVHLTLRDWASWAIRWWAPRNVVKIPLLKEKGMQFITLPEAEEAKLLQTALILWDSQAAQDPVVAKAVQILKDYYKEVGRM